MSNPESQQPYDKVTAYEIAWGMFSSRIGKLNEACLRAEDNNAADQYRETMRALIATRDGLNPENREAVEVATALLEVIPVANIGENTASAAA